MKIITLYEELHKYHHEELGSVLYNIPESFNAKERITQHQFNIFLWRNPFYNKLSNVFKVRFSPQHHKNMH